MSEIASARGNEPTVFARKSKIIAVLELAVAAGIVFFWVAFFTTDMVRLSEPRLREIYLAFESAFPAADLFLAFSLAAGGLGLLRKRAYGRLFTLAGGAALIFLGLLDISFNSRQGIYGLGFQEAVLNGAINFVCLIVGSLLVRTIWIAAIKGQGIGQDRIKPATKSRPADMRHLIRFGKGTQVRQRITGRRILITGASSGIGKALALEFARKGARLALVSRRHEKLQEAADDVQAAVFGIERPLVVACDVSDPESVRRMIETVDSGFGGIDILVNNAGVGVYGNAEKISFLDFHSVMDVNFFGAVHCIFEALPVMRRAGRGTIVNIASVAAIHGVPYLSAYSASKAALVALCQSLRGELHMSGVDIMIAYPNYTQTEFFRNEKKVGSARRPSGPYADPAKVAGVIVNAVEKGKKELVISAEGKALSVLKPFFPRLIENVMAGIAARLREPEEVFHG